MVGYYRNELGSCMEITSAEDGYIKGCYGSAVGTEFKYPLIGQYDKEGGNAIGWVVSYQTANSTAAWTGQVIRDGSGTYIHTTWLLAQSSTEPNLWESTNVGCDLFTKFCIEDQASYKAPVSVCPRHSSIPKSVLEKEKKK